jgi:glyoxylase-like metal-dependent hydrolase (beta-lactamase superfamily II)
MRIQKRLLVSLMALAAVSACEIHGPATSQAASTLFSQPWNSGLKADEPAFQVQQIDADTLAIRQSLRTTFEAPFLYLLFGDDKALLIDTGVEGVDLRGEIDRQIDDWQARTGHDHVSLIVMHSHGHGDHIGGDAGFEGRPDTVIVGHTPEDVAAFFSLKDWPTQPASFDLGNRTVDILPTPGHHPSHVAVFDETTGILFSGDAIYPGRLYFQCGKAAEFKASMDRIAAFAKDHPINWILGGHIEMKAAAGKSFNSQGPSRHNEHLLELPASIIGDIETGLNEMGDPPRVTQFDEFVLFPHPANPAGKSPPDWCQGEGEQD